MTNIKMWMGLFIFGALVMGSASAQSSSDIWRLESKIDQVSSRVDRVDSNVNRMDWDVRGLGTRVSNLERQISQLPTGNAPQYNRGVDAKIDLNCVDRLNSASSTVLKPTQVIAVLNSCREAVDTNYCYKESEVSNSECFNKANSICASVLTADETTKFELACKTQKFRCQGSR